MKWADAKKLLTEAKTSGVKTLGELRNVLFVSDELTDEEIDRLFDEVERRFPHGQERPSDRS